MIYALALRVGELMRSIYLCADELHDTLKNIKVNAMMDGTRQPITNGIYR